ncbi:MarR family transcriptional regulator [Candidatus Uhrbacteria bacterium CG_4_10_14_0_2_um_filter_41_7]|uniref:MarR family transcriptional regulator n=1 Tax=Candidatus Uhrbacteria bacterium CG_4_9_14_3_um_filter_41_35 TaxID=1975034 RepID=A0A2M7XFH9_9BACT|nr:MAG: MarR family transcriptional regulator [Candidatus Uhrbacteria bacterium CG11_big_fil_rev_8_21_14_0_20_41_9]PIZ55721.1 MAG: MarR family transcriptional regulator [Candidatus Uhrbacteria bacterium CG_4_10_14_0_2_um_filter_41_7]PJA46650.1 MAG: MarR family transcriptional regulator [Candidatus Uhrbacteria bacterium CG_4_9_14_3_um_filter_41_35]
MINISESVQFLLNLSKIEAIVAKKFNFGMGNGIGFNEFLILHYLNQPKNHELRRIDLADQIAVTASGITRMLVPMEKIGLVSTGPSETDARVRLVQISDSGREKYEEALERLELLLEEVMPTQKKEDIQRCSDLMLEIGGKFLIK